MSKARWVPVAVPALTLTLISRVRRCQCWRVRLVVRALVAGLRALELLHVRLLALLRLPVHRRRLLISLRRRWILPTLLRRRVLIRTTTMLRERLTVRAVELGVGWRVLTAPDRVRRDERLGLRAHWREDTFLGEALTVGAATILRLVEA